MQDGAFQIRPAREEDIRWATQLSMRVYHGLDVIPEARMVEWFRANPHGFWIFWHGERRVGNLDLLPLRADAMQRFVDGTLFEVEMRPEMLVPPAERAAMRDLHWESIVIDPDFQEDRRTLLRLFANSFLQMLSHLCPVEQIRNIYAIAASDKGAGVLRRMGLTMVGDAAHRVDAHPLYRGTVADYRHAAERMFPQV